MKHLKYIPYGIGLCVLLATLIGARKLTPNPEPQGAGGRQPAPMADGLVAKGNVSAEYEPMGFYLPAHLAAGQVTHVLVKNGQMIKKGDLLVRFDDWNYQTDLKKAEASVQAAMRLQIQAQTKKEQHKILIEKAQLAVSNAETTRNNAKNMLEAVRKKLDFQIRQLGGGQPNIEKAVREEPDFLKVEALLDAAEDQLKEKKLDVKLLESESLDAMIEAAAFQVQAAQTEVEKAKQAIARCEMKADIDGIVERVAVAPGQVMYPQARSPMFWLIPEGNRYVKAEIVPEFAHKIRDKDGVKVLISDDSTPGLTYEGVVEQIGTAFLPKTGGVDLLNGKQTNVLEVSIRVIDPAPPGKPSLRVGQPVRVTIP